MQIKDITLENFHLITTDKLEGSLIPHTKLYELVASFRSRIKDEKILEGLSFHNLDVKVFLEVQKQAGKHCFDTTGLITLEEFYDIYHKHPKFGCKTFWAFKQKVTYPRTKYYELYSLIFKRHLNYRVYVDTNHPLYNEVLEKILSGSRK